MRTDKQARIQPETHTGIRSGGSPLRFLLRTHFVIVVI